jgi:hypothetical protein
MFQGRYGGGPEICLFIVENAEESYNILCEAGYIGGYPDLNPISITVEYEERVISVMVSRYIPLTIFNSWISNSQNLPSRRL